MTLTAPHRSPRPADTTAAPSPLAPGTALRAPAGVAPPVVAWVATIAEVTRPDGIEWCDGSQAEFDRLTRRMVATGTLQPLSAEHRHYSFLARSAPDDVARVESRTFICSEREEDAGPTNN